MSPDPDATTDPGPVEESPPSPKPPQRVAPISAPLEEVVLPKPDEQQPAQIRDAFRECAFALPREIAWLREALSLQHRIAAASTGSRWRNQRYAAALLLWSRVYNAGIELLTATTWANYTVCPPLVRASLEWLGAEQAVVGEEIRDYEAWLAAAFEPEREYAATDVGMGQYLAGQQLAMAPRPGDDLPGRLRTRPAPLRGLSPAGCAGVEPTADRRPLGRSGLSPGLGAIAVGLADRDSGAAGTLCCRTGAVRRGRGGTGAVPSAQPPSREPLGRTGPMPY